MIREATMADAREIARIHVEAWRCAYRGIVSDAYLDAMSVDRRQARWVGVLCESDGGIVVLETNDGIVGWASYGKSRDADDVAAGEIYGIYLQASHWRRGFGRQLMAHAEGELAAAGVSDATLWVLAQNGPARRFYEALGYRRDETVKTTEIGGSRLSEERYRKRIRAD